MLRLGGNGFGRETKPISKEHKYLIINIFGPTFDGFVPPYSVCDIQISKSCAGDSLRSILSYGVSRVLQTRDFEVVLNLWIAIVFDL